MNSELKIIRWDYKMEENILEKRLQDDDKDLQKILSAKGVEKRIILRTCNRLEIYYHEDVLFSDDEMEYAEVLSDEDAIRHLLRVASGLESMSVGEQEILRQIKEAFDAAHKQGRTDKFLSMIFQRAIKVGKEVRETTEISHGKVSIPSIMIEQIERKGLLHNRSIGVIGTGKMAATVVKYLRKKPSVKITLYGRNDEAGSELSQLFAVNFKKTLDVGTIVEECHVVITATSSKTPLITRDIIEKIDRNLLFIDISNPRNIEESYNNPKVELINLEMANQILQENRRRKEKDIEVAESIIDREMKKIYAKMAESEIEGYIASIYSRSKDILNDEIEKYRHSMENGLETRDALEMLGNSIVNKVLAPETLTLKKMIREGKTESVRDFLDSAMKFTDKDIGSLSEDQRESQNPPIQNRQLCQKS
ncbi:MAG: glutamyl-tRNA reductase [Cuniculiplasma sp.]